MSDSGLACVGGTKDLTQKAYRSKMCTLNNCICRKEWLDSGWICGVVWKRKGDRMWKQGDCVKFKDPTRVWSEKVGVSGSYLVMHEGWHNKQTYVVHAVNRTKVFTQVLVVDNRFGSGWVNVWRSTKGVGVVWATKVAVCQSRMQAPGV